MKRCRLYLIILPILVLTMATAILSKPVTVFAAYDPSLACRTIFANAQQPPVSVSKIKANHPFIKTCIEKGYPAGYKNPTNNDDSAACPATDPHLTFCQLGFKKGQSDAKVATGTPTPSAATIKKNAEKACQPYADQNGLSADDRKDNFDACVDGYTGQFAGKDSDTACRHWSGHALSACIKGFQAATNKKPIVLPGTATASPTGPTGGAGDPNSLELDCDAGFNPLNWLVCGAVKGMVAVLRGVDGVINSLLAIGTPDEEASGDPTNVFDTSTESGKNYHKAWASFRNIALGLLVVAGLTMVMAQALGMEILDAYTVRKVLPRLIIVSIAITISWPGLHFVVELFNDLGFGVRYLIQSPFHDALDNTIKLSGGQGTAVLVATPVAFLALGIFGLITFVGTALLAALIAFLVLVLRQIVVIVLVIIAPIALVCYILPNTQKYWKIWLDSLGGALLMFPIISAIIAGGRVFSAVANNGGGVNETLDSFIAFAAYFAPYFLIPATFKFAGGALRSIGGFVNDRGRGGFDRLRKARQDSTGRRIKAARSGGIYRDDFLKFGDKGRSVGKMANKFGNWTLDFDEQSRVSLGQSRIPGGRALFGRSSDIMKGQIEDATLAHSRKALQDVGGLHYQAGRALGGQMQYFAGTRNKDGTWSGGDEDLSQASRDMLMRDFGNFDKNGNFDGTWKAPTGKKDVERLGSILSTGGASSTMAAQELLAKAPMLGNFKGAGKEETQRADLATMGLMAAAQAGRLEEDEIAATRAISAGNIDQPGLGSKRVAMLQQMATPKRNEQREGHGIQYRAVRDAAGNIVQDPKTRQPMMEAYSVYEDPFSEQAQAAIMSMTSNDIAASKSETIDAIAETMVVGASKYKHIEGPLDAKGKKTYIRTNQLKTDEKEVLRAEAMRKRIEYLAVYSQGDSDAGRKLSKVMDRVGMKPPKMPGADGAPVILQGGGAPPAAPGPTPGIDPHGGPAP